MKTNDNDLDRSADVTRELVNKSFCFLGWLKAGGKPEDFETAWPEIENQTNRVLQMVYGSEIIKISP